MTQNHNNSYDNSLVDDINIKAQLLIDTHHQQKYEYNTTNNNSNNYDESMISSAVPTTMTTTTYATTTRSYLETEMVLIIGNDRKFNFSNLLELDIRYWLLILNFCILSGSVQPFMNIGSSYLQNTYNYTQENGNLLLIIPYIICTIFTPLIGYFVDIYGGRCQWLLLSSIILSLSYYIIGNIDIGINNSYYPILSLIGIGCSYSSMTAIIWPSFALVVDAKLLATAYGIQTSIYNVILATYYLIVGALIDKDNINNNMKYKDVNRFLLINSILSIFTVLLLWYKDEKYQKQINKQNNRNNDQIDMSQIA